MVLEQYSMPQAAGRERHREQQVIQTDSGAWGLDLAEVHPLWTVGEQYWQLLQRSTRGLAATTGKCSVGLGALQQRVQGFTDIAAAIDDWLRTWAPSIHEIPCRAMMVTSFMSAARRELGGLSDAVSPIHESARSAATALSAAVEQFVGSPGFVTAATREVRQLLARGRLGEAYTLAAWAASKRRDSDPLAGWADVLKPVPARSGGLATGRSRQREENWLRRHAHEHEGEWVALLGDRLVAAGARLAEVRESVSAAGHEADVLLHFIPEEPNA
jgi:hypothetical protein